MRELNSKEVANVSGGFIFGGIGQAIGEAIGGAVSEAVKEAAGLLGKGIGNILDFNVVGAITNMSNGIRGIVEWSKSIKAE